MLENNIFIEGQKKHETDKEERIRVKQRALIASRKVGRIMEENLKKINKETKFFL